MALPSTGTISLNDVRNELNLSGSISLGSAAVRSLAGIASGAISLADLRGKSARIIRTLTSGSPSGTTIFRGWDSGLIVTSVNSGYSTYGSIDNRFFQDGREATSIFSRSNQASTLYVYLMGTQAPSWTKIVFNGTQYNISWTAVADKSGNTYIQGQATISGVYTSLAPGNSRTVEFV